MDGVNIADITEEKAYEVKAKMDATGLKVWSVGSPIGKIGIKDAAVHIEKFKHVIKLAEILGAENIRLFSLHINDGRKSDECMDDVVAFLKKLLDLAKPSGITLCHENEKGIYGDIAERCLKIHKALPEIKAIFDPANYVQCGVDTLKAWEMLKPYVKYLHIKDALTDGKNPQHIGVLNAFADAILNGGDLVAKGQDGINGLTLSNAMHLSAFLGKEIELPFDDDLYYSELTEAYPKLRTGLGLNLLQ